MQTSKPRCQKKEGARGLLGLALLVMFSVLGHPSHSAAKDSEGINEICKKVEAVIDISAATDLLIHRRAAEATLRPEARVCSAGYCYPSVQAFFQASTDILFMRNLIQRDVNQLALACKSHFSREFKKGDVEGKVIYGSPVETTVKELIEGGFSPMGAYGTEFTELPKNSKISVDTENWGDKAKNLRYVCIDFSRYFEQNDVKDETQATKEPVCIDAGQTVSETEFKERLSKILDQRLGTR